LELTSGDVTAGDLGEGQGAGLIMRVAGLHYGLAWRSNRLRWAPEVFPANVWTPGWSIEVTERRLTARPNDVKFYDEGGARAALEPELHAWVAELTVVHDLPLEYWFLDAEMVPDVAIALSGHGELTVGDGAGLVDEVEVVITRSALPGPTWRRPPSSFARDAREYCLLPLRGQRRGEADAAYWLVEQVNGWAGNEAATRLNVSHGVLSRMKTLSGRALDRKATPGNQPLTLDERALLRRMVELVVHRLHLYEVGEPIGEHITLDQV
jgi:hypothetical protein